MANPVKMLRGNKDKSSHPGKKRWNSRALGRARAMFAYLKDYKSATRGPAVKTTTQQEPRSRTAATSAPGSRKPEPQTSTKTPARPLHPEVSAIASKPQIASHSEQEQTPSTSSVVEHLKSSDIAQSSHASDDHEDSSTRDEEQQNSIPPEVNSTTSEAELEGSCTDLCAAAVALKTLQQKSYHLAQENKDLIAHLSHLRLQMDNQQKDSELKYLDALMKQHLLEKALEKEVIKLAKIQSRLAVELEKNAQLRASLFMATNELDIQRVQWEKERASLLKTVQACREARRNVKVVNKESSSERLILNNAEAIRQGSASDTKKSSSLVNTKDTKQVPVRNISKNVIEDRGEDTKVITDDQEMNTEKVGLKAATENTIEGATQDPTDCGTQYSVIEITDDIFADYKEDVVTELTEESFEEITNETFGGSKEDIASESVWESKEGTLGGTLGGAKKGILKNTVVESKQGTAVKNTVKELKGKTIKEEIKKGHTNLNTNTVVTDKQRPDIHTKGSASLAHTSTPDINTKGSASLAHTSTPDINTKGSASLAHTSKNQPQLGESNGPCLLERIFEFFI